MKVIHSCTSKSFSGLEGYVFDLAHWQYKQGMKVELFCRKKSELHERALKTGVPVWAIEHDDEYGPRLWVKLKNDWREKLNSGPLILHMHAGGEPWFHLPWLIKRDKNLKKSILHYHIWINHKKKDPFHWAFYRGVDEVWASSESYRAHLTTILPVGRERIRVIPYGRNVAGLLALDQQKLRSETRKKFNIPEPAMLAVCISRIEPIKGISELFHAFIHIAKTHRDAYLIIVGDASPENEEARLYTEKLKSEHARLSSDLQHRLLMPGFVNPATPILAAADFYVLPTYEECMSLAMLDSLILGVPVLGTNSGGTPSVAIPDETGGLFKPQNTEALANALDEFFSNPEKCRKLSNGARLLGQHFDQEKIFQKITDAYSGK